MTTIKFRFTKRLLEALKAPAVGREYHLDAGQDHLAVCVTANGTKTFYRVGRIDGRPVRIRIGTYPDLSVENARTIVRKMTGDIAQGKNPHQERLARRHEQTLGALASWWIDHAKGTKRSWKADEWQIEKYLSAWKARKLSSISKPEVVALHGRIGRQHGHYTANRLLALLRAMLNKADNIGFEGNNPCKGIKAFREESRAEFLKPEQIPQFFAALEQEEQVLQDFFYTLVLTGARRGAVASMRWEDVDLENAVWRIPPTASKNKKATLVHLPAKAVEILERRLSEKGGSPWVFSSSGAPLQSPKHAWERIRKRAGLPDLRMHDLRRTLGSWMAIGGASLTVVGKALGHQSLQSTAVYARLTEAPVAEAVDKATTAIIAAGNGGEA